MTESQSLIPDPDLVRELRAANESLVKGLDFEKRLRFEMSCLLTEPQKDACYARASMPLAGNAK